MTFLIPESDPNPKTFTQTETQFLPVIGSFKDWFDNIHGLDKKLLTNSG